MGNHLILYSVNIAMEVTMILVLAIMLITVIWQKHTFLSTVPLIFLTSCIIVNLVVQVITWTFLINDVPTLYGAMPMRIVYALDFISLYGASVAFYYYVEAIAVASYEQVGITHTPRKITKKILHVWGVVVSVIYIVALFVPSVYHVEDGETFFSIPAYIIMHIITEFACVSAILFVFHHRNVMGKHVVMTCIVYSILVSGFIIVDELFELCIGRVTVAISTLILYVSIDLHMGLLLEREEREIVELKTATMLSQMQPHFLYNVLTTISSMCEMQGAVQARDVVNRFADYFRANLDSLGKEKTVSFEKELEHVKTYLWLEKVRFEDSLNVCYEIGPSDFLVPSLTIQPMVENAVKHGILPKEEGGTITIKTYETDSANVIVIEDDGIGFDINEINKDDLVHIGIENVSRRLEIISKGAFKIHSEKGKGTVVTISVPKGEK